jgi:hypothetical protein
MRAAFNHRVASPVAFVVFPTEVVVGQDSEHADMSNPRGLLYGTANVISARDEHGNTAEAPERFLNDPEAAERFVAALAARLASGKLPVGFANWTEGRAVYGSPAYVEYGAEEDLATERNEAEDEAFRF